MGTIANDGIVWREPAPDESALRTVLFGTAPNGVTYAIDHTRLSAGFVVFYSPVGDLPNVPVWTPIVATLEEAQALALGHAAAMLEVALGLVDGITEPGPVSDPLKWLNGVTELSECSD